MKSAALCLFTALALLGCNRPTTSDDDASPAAAAAKAAPTPDPTPKPGEWMWKKKGKLKNTDPLDVPEDPFDQKPKKGH